MPRSPGHVFYDRLQEVLIAGGFDVFRRDGLPALLRAEDGAHRRCRRAAISACTMVGYFEGIASERGIAWRCSDSYSLRDFLRLEKPGRGSRSLVAVEDARSAST